MGISSVIPLWWLCNRGSMEGLSCVYLRGVVNVFPFFRRNELVLNNKREAEHMFFHRLLNTVRGALESD